MASPASRFVIQRTIAIPIFVVKFPLPVVPKVLSQEKVNRMKSNSTVSCSSTVDPRRADEARAELCQRVACMLRDGAVGVRVRLDSPTGEAWFYEHKSNAWHKQADVIHDRTLACALSEQLDILASKPDGDILKIARHDASDWHETDLHFRRDAIAHRLDDKLESYVLGLLFGDHHDSKQDIRRHPRSGPQHGGARG